MISYCLNLFPTRSVQDLAHNLAQLPPGCAPGLWLPHQLLASGADLPPVQTFNAFPYQDFHQPKVKHQVYRPDWSQPERLHYTQAVAHLLDRLLDQKEGSISTLPLGWEPLDERQAVANLEQMAQTLKQIEETSGHWIHLDLEPEPGCLLTTSQDLIRFFERHQLDRRYLGVCHDICHAAVMGEDQARVLQAYQRAGIRVGKVQVSSALRVHDPIAARPTLQRLAGDRYLHQCRLDDGRFFEDLPDYLASDAKGPLTIHFHVPIHLDHFGPGLSTTRGAIEDCLAALAGGTMLEIETYTLPDLEPDPAKVMQLEFDWLSAKEIRPTGSKAPSL